MAVEYLLPASGAHYCVDVGAKMSVSVICTWQVDFSYYFDDVFFNEMKILSEKCIVLLCNSNLCDIKRVQKMGLLKKNTPNQYQP
jgi:hypothetical protein